MKRWEYNGYFGAAREIRLEPGAFDENARDVFCRGHCHSLALAIRELIPDAELYGAWVEGELEHVFAWIPGFGFLDGYGLHESEEDAARELHPLAEIDWLEDYELERLEEIGRFRANRAGDAVPFARVLIEHEGIGELAAAA